MYLVVYIALALCCAYTVKLQYWHPKFLQWNKKVHSVPVYVVEDWLEATLAAPNVTWLYQICLEITLDNDIFYQNKLVIVMLDGCSCANKHCGKLSHEFVPISVIPVV